MAWRIEGTYFENCSCDMVCPCTTSSLSLPGDTERCLVAFFFNVASGDVDGVDVGGLTVGLAFSNVGKNGHSAPFAWAA